MTSEGKGPAIDDEIRCPKCGYVLELADRGRLVTYWGEGDWQEDFCGRCEHEFEVKEHVHRMFETRELKR